MADEKQQQKYLTNFDNIFEYSSDFITDIIKENPSLPGILQMMRDGNATVELRKRYILRAIDEAWVTIVEDTLPCLDVIIRSPSKVLEEIEEVLPIELSRNISVRSLQHLAQHTNMISKIEGDKITPSKILNIYREETFQTYENKFINTLLSRLYTFVSRRYEIVQKAGQDEKTTELTFTEEFMHNNARVNINFSLTLSEITELENAKIPERSYTKTTDLWARVQRLYGIVSTYANSDFVKTMGHSYIRPPVMRTNAILKNKNLRQCLALWQFIETYENAGYAMLVEEDLEKMDDRYIEELYSSIALQYLLFRYSTENEFATDTAVLDRMLSAEEIKPKIVSELEEVKEEDYDIEGDGSVVFDSEKLPSSPSVVRFNTVTPEDRMMMESIDVAVEAAKIMTENGYDDYVVDAYIPEPVPVERSEYESTEDVEEEIPEQTDSENGEATEAESPEAPVERVRTPVDDFSDRLAVILDKVRNKEKITEELAKEMQDAFEHFSDEMHQADIKRRLTPTSRVVKQINRAKRRARRKNRGK